LVFVDHDIPADPHIGQGCRKRAFVPAGVAVGLSFNHDSCAHALIGPFCGLDG